MISSAGLRGYAEYDCVQRALAGRTKAAGGGEGESVLLHLSALVGNAVYLLAANFPAVDERCGDPADRRLPRGLDA
jgi:azurin